MTDTPAITSSTTAETSTHTIDLTITGGPTIEAGEEYTVTGLRIAYRDRQVTQITYTTDREDVSVHPDYLDTPDAWPSWVREQVDKHRPASRQYVEYLGGESAKLGRLEYLLERAWRKGYDPDMDDVAEIFGWD